jgi:Tfp pilus assembly protein FimT
MDLLITIAIIGVVTAMAIPNFMSYLPNYRLKSATQDLFSNFQKAKLAAVKRNTNTAVTFPGSGYVVFVDADRDFVKDSGEEVVAQVAWAEYQDLSAGANTFDNSSGQPCIAFRSNGLPVVNSGGLASGAATLNNTNGKSLIVQVSQAGSIQIN